MSLQSEGGDEKVISVRSVISAKNNPGKKKELTIFT